MKVDKNIPVATRVRGRQKYPWHEMNVGDSILCLNVVRSVPLTSAKEWAKRHKKKYKFTARKENGGIRIWRVK